MSEWKPLLLAEDKYTDAEAVAAVAAADDYIKNDEDDVMNGKLTIKGLDLIGGQKIVGEQSSGVTYPGCTVYGYNGITEAHPFSGFYNAAGSEASPAILPVNYSVGLFTFDAYNGSAFKTMARFGGMTEPSFDGTHQNGRLEFSVGHDSTFAVQMALLTNGNLDIKNNVIQDPKNHAASALSGTKKVVEIDIGGVPYYYEVYPTKA